jgi:hypothetical protein
MPVQRKTQVVLEMASEIVPHHLNTKYQHAKWMLVRQISVKQKTIIGVTKFVRCTQKPRRHPSLALCNVSVSNAAGASRAQNLL